MPDYLAPGVYVEEQSFGLPTLSFAPTSIAAFVGTTAGGARLEPKRLASFADFEREFAGGADALRPGRHGRIFALGVRAYFENGGGELVVVRVRTHDPQELLEALAALASIEDVCTVAAPAAPRPQDVHALLIAHAQSLERIALLDPPRGASVAELSRLRSTFDSPCAAFYAPRVVVADAPNLRLAPSSFIAGVFARVDASRSFWKAPANEVLMGASALEHAFGDADQDQLNPRGVNLLRDIAGRGLRVWGARTASSNPERRYVNVQRALQCVSLTLQRGLTWAVFESNDERLWARLRASVEKLLATLWRNGALEGTKPSEAFFVRCDRSTMTQGDIDARLATVECGLALVRPAEFAVLRCVVRTS